MSLSKYWELHAPDELKKKKKTLAAKRNWIVKDTGTVKLPSGFSKWFAVSVGCGKSST